MCTYTKAPLMPVAKALLTDEENCALKMPSNDSSFRHRDES